MNTAVYGGSFNPLHIGHLAILETLVALYDKVLLVVSPQNPLKKEADPASASSRLNAAREAVSRHAVLTDGHVRGTVEVSDIEFGLPLPNYTINTLDALAATGLYGDISLVVGGDQIADIRRWRDYRRILLDYGIAAFPREGYDNAAARWSLLAENPSYRIRLIDMPLVNVSSSQIREALAAGEDISRLLM